jgi:hypothetical protein
MRWCKKTSLQPYSQAYDVVLAEEKIWEAYSEGYINWYIYQKALAKIRTNMNGSWMFEQQQKEEEAEG